jgi:tol-pal system protein YbgF
MYPGVLGGLCLLSFLATGCATQGAVEKVQIDLRRVEARIVLVGGQLSVIDSLLQLQNIESRRQWTELSTDGGDIIQRVQQMQARLDEVTRQLVETRQEVEAVRVYGVGKGASPQSVAAARGPADTTGAAGPSLVSDSLRVYNMAMNDMKSGNYPLAISEFGQFVESFPGDELADNALYWQGECYYASKEFPRAVAVFERVLAEYPKGDKVPAAKLKLGYTLLEMKQKKKGTQHLRELIKQHPGSEEAALAKARLK